MNTETERLEAAHLANLRARIGAEEMEVVSRIVKLARKHDLRMRVHDGEDYAWQEGTTPTQAIAAIGHTEESVIHLEKDGVRAGWLRLIHGNGRDVLADYALSSYSAMIGEAITRGAE